MSERPPGLPAPSAAEEALSARLGAAIRAEIEAAGGALGFERFMDLALYAPGLGYYSRSDAQFGAGGDFVTAPELSPMFGGCVARTVAAVLAALGGGDVVEVGAGSGALAASLLAALARSGSLPRRYLVLERSAALRERQAARLREACPEASDRVAWLDDLPAPGFHGVVVANELLDALAVECFRRDAGAVQACRVAWTGERFAWRLDPAPPRLARAVEAIERDVGTTLPAGYRGEVGPAREAWVSTLAERIERGVALILDYGYDRRELYHPQRAAGTVTCHYRHRRHDDPLVLVGLQDISAHVDFTGVARAGLAAGLDLAGFTTQADYLLDCGLLDACAALGPGTPGYVRAAEQVKRLTLPGEMGALVKVMALARGVESSLPGFRGRDLRDRLGIG